MVTTIKNTTRTKMRIKIIATVDDDEEEDIVQSVALVLQTVPTQHEQLEGQT
jgi:hypothetical protein